MNFLLKFFLAVTVFKTIVVFLLFVGAIVAWISGASNIIFPGLGLIVSMPFLAIVLFGMEIVLVTISVILWRTVSKLKLKRFSLR